MIKTETEIAKESKQSGAICGDGMCPYVPCVEYPKCKHIEKILKDGKE